MSQTAEIRPFEPEMGRPTKGSRPSRGENSDLGVIAKPGLLAITAINMIDIWVGFFVKLRAKSVNCGQPRNLGINMTTDRGLFSPNILSREASNHGGIAELKAIQCYQSAHLTGAFGPVAHPATISLVKSKSGKASP